MGKPEQEFEVCPFTVVIDSNEGAPWLFRDFKARGTGKPLVIKTVNKPLWSTGKREVLVKGSRMMHGLADYSIDGMEELIQIERKSHEDLYGTLGARRDQFESEIARLNLCEFAVVIIECGWGQLAEAPENSSLKPASVIGTIIAWQQRYPKVHWITAGTRAQAERLAFRVLERFWEDHVK
jgi:ERCC4-type nuclease